MRANATLRDFFSALGADLAATSASQIAASLERGGLQGFGFPTIAVSGLGVLSHIKYRLEPTFYRGNNLLIINLDTWNRLPEPVRKSLAGLAVDAERYSKEFIAAAAEREGRALAAAGVQSINLDGVVRRDFLARAGDVVWDRLAERVPDKVESLKAKFYAR
jgi:TRAP-type C4-dicarboxylate transport system substrate-binding protein